MTVPDTMFDCPLLQRRIAEGLCVDINLERIGAFKPESLAEAMRESHKSVGEVSAVCERCPNRPV